MKPPLLNLLTAIIFLGSCAKPVQVIESFHLRGIVSLVDEFGDTLAVQGGTQVGLKNTSISTTSDEKGEWTLANIPKGSYSLRFSKEGFISYEFPLVHVDHEPNELYRLFAKLFQPPSFTVELSNMSQIPGRIVRITGGVSTPHIRGRKVMLFFSTSANVSSNPGQYDSYVDLQLPPDEAVFIKEISVSAPAGTQLYCVAYPACNSPLYAYWDRTAEQSRFSSIGNSPSNLKSITIQ